VRTVRTVPGVPKGVGAKVLGCSGARWCTRVRGESTGNLAKRRRSIGLSRSAYLPLDRRGPSRYTAAAAGVMGYRVEPTTRYTDKEKSLGSFTRVSCRRFSARVVGLPEREVPR